MNIHISRKPLKSRPVLFFVFVLFIVSAIDFPEVDIPNISFVKSAEAVVGRPATPGSVAGVHRRTRRRTYRRLTTLPRGCTTVVTRGVTYHRCSGVYYQPVYESTTLVYIEVENP